MRNRIGTSNILSLSLSTKERGGTSNFVVDDDDQQQQQQNT